MRRPTLGLRTLAAIAACAAGLLLADARGAQAAPIEVRDGDGGSVFSGGPGSVNLTIQVDRTRKTVAAGAFALQYRFPSSGGWTDFLTYCLEPDVPLGVGSSAVSGDLLPASGTTEFGAKAGVLSNYYGTWYADSLRSATRSAAFQLGLWELAYDIGGHLGRGSFQLVSASDAVLRQAEAYLDPSRWTNQAEMGIILRSRPDNQDLTVVLPSSGRAEVIPEPAALILFAAGLVGLGLVMRRWGRAAVDGLPKP